jgi:hypothetical protein
MANVFQLRSGLLSGDFLFIDERPAKIVEPACPQCTGRIIERGVNQRYRQQRRCVEKNECVYKGIIMT